MRKKDRWSGACDNKRQFDRQSSVLWEKHEFFNTRRGSLNHREKHLHLARINYNVNYFLISHLADISFGTLVVLFEDLALYSRIIVFLGFAAWVSKLRSRCARRHASANKLLRLAKNTFAKTALSRLLDLFVLRSRKYGDVQRLKKKRRTKR